MYCPENFTRRKILSLQHWELVTLYNRLSRASCTRKTQCSHLWNPLRKVCHCKLGADDLFRRLQMILINWKLGWLWIGYRGVRGRNEVAGCEGCECDARRTGSIFYHCSVLSSLMDPTWAEHSTTFRHIAQAGGRTHGKTEEVGAREVDRAAHEKVRQRQRRGRETESGSNHHPKNNHNPKHENILFHRHAVTAFPITAGPECICRSWETLLIRTARN